MRDEHDRLVARYLRSLFDDHKRTQIDQINCTLRAMNDRDRIPVAITVQPSSMIDPIDPRRI